MKHVALSYPMFLVLFVVTDFVWLGATGDRIYRRFMGDMVLDNFRIGPAVVFYLLYAAGAVYFAVAPGLGDGGWREAALRGLFFGLCAYGTYDLTNHATLKSWSTSLSIIDMGWGALLTGVAAGGAAFLAGKLA